jgi:hypothetical protein
MPRPFAQAPGGARRAATFFRVRGLFSVAALIPLAPTFQAAGQIAEHVSERAAARPTAVFPVRANPDWGEADARFGAYRGGHMHEGQDGGRGNYVAIWSAEAEHTFVYLHMLRPTPLEPGDRVTMGERIGAVGCTGSCWGDHLHFEIRAGRGTTAPPRDPLPVLQRLAARR